MTGDLHRECAHPSRRADDQHALSRFEASDVAEPLKGREPRDRDDRGLIEREVRRFARELVLASARVFPEGTSTDAEDLVTDREPGHVCPRGHDRSGDARGRARGSWARATRTP
jgi:hypothetical protein